MKAILTYHSIDDSASPISISRDAFESHVRWLRSGRVRVLSLSDLLAEPDDSGADAVSVVFDDGIANTAEPVRDLLDEGVPVTLFAVTQRVGTTNQWSSNPPVGVPTLPLLGWGDLESLKSAGASIEAHTRRHRMLIRESGAALDDELEGCRHDLRERLGIDASHFAYPFGCVDDAVATAASKVFRHCYTTEMRLLSASADASRIPRLDMFYFRRPGTIETWGTARFARRLSWIRRRRALRSAMGIGPC